MSQYARLSAEDAHQMLFDQAVNIVDIRDADSYKLAHITKAVHLDNTGIQSFINDADQAIPLIICCYHGNMSQSAGVYLADKGFAQVYSLDGGFAEWASRFPDDCEAD